MRRPRPPFWLYLLRPLIRALLRLLFHLEVRGLEHVPHGGYVLASNHLNWVDSFLIGAYLPMRPQLRFLAAAEMTMGVGWRRTLLNSAQLVIPVDRAQVLPGPIKACLAHLRACGVLGIFPEGREADAEGQLLPLKPGAAYFALTTGLPILPVGISGTRSLCLRRRIRLRVGPPLFPQPGEDRGVLSARLAEGLQAALPPLAADQPEHQVWPWLTDLLH